MPPTPPFDVENNNYLEDNSNKKKLCAKKQGVHSLTTFVSSQIIFVFDI